MPIFAASMFSLRLLPDAILIQDRLMGLKKKGFLEYSRTFVNSEEFPFSSQFCAMFTKQEVFDITTMKVSGLYLLQSSFP